MEEVEYISFSNLMHKYTGLTKDELFDEEILLKYAKEHQIGDVCKGGFRQLWDSIYKKKCVYAIEQPTLVFDYPAHPLAKLSDCDNRFSQEIYLIVNKIELIHAYLELNDPAENFKKQMTSKGERVENDSEYVDGLKYGLIPTAGFGMGIDRLVQYLLQLPSIRDAIIFANMRNKKE